MAHDDNIFMNRCLQLAQEGLGLVQPNPLVGCVIVCNGIIIGEGFHRVFGGPHAEVNAINSVADKSLLRKSMLYVNLEPCCHFGKTPPCTDLILEHKIPKVIVGCKDTFTEVSGMGIKKLKSAGCKVISDVLEKESRFINRRFFNFHEKKRPYVILKWAQTGDGFIGSRPTPRNLRDYGLRRQERISGELSHALVHKWRSEEQAVMVGTRTALFDNPQLTVRKWKGKNPVRIVIDRTLKLSHHLRLFDARALTWVFTSRDVPSNMLKRTGKTEFIPVDFTGKIIHNILTELHLRNIQSVIVEGGAKLLNSFIDSGLWDEARVFTSHKVFKNGIKAPEIPGKIYAKEIICEDELMITFPPEAGLSFGRK